MRPSDLEIRTEDVRGREEVARLAPLDPESALHRARKINHPWYRCQALSFVAQAQRSRSVALLLLRESLAAAYEQAEPNRIVSVASWPLRQLVKMDPAAAFAQTQDLLRIISNEEHGLRRLNGVARVLVAVAERPELLELTKPAFVAAAAASQGWRTERAVGSVASLLAPIDPAFAQSLVASRAPSRFVRAAMKALQSAS